MSDLPSAAPNVSEAPSPPAFGGSHHSKLRVKISGNLVPKPSAPESSGHRSYFKSFKEK